MRRLPSAIAAVLVILTAGFALQDITWDGPFTPIPGPPGGNPVGDFEQRTGTMPDGAGGTRPVIVFRFVPKPNAFGCNKTAIVQTFSEYFINNDGTTEIITKPSDYYKVNPPEPDKVRRDRARKVRHADPNTVNGVTVDAAYSDKDPYYNGNDAEDRGEQGDRTKGTWIGDSPSTGPDYFSGKRQVHVIDYEVCAYCMKDDGTLGIILACMTWQYRKTKNGATQIISPMTGTTSTKTASAGHTAAANQWVRRHTRNTPGGVLNFCPEAVQDSLDVASQLNTEMQGMEDGTDKEALRARIARIMSWIRGQRGS